MLLNLITDIEIAEAIIGGLGFGIMIWYFRDLLKWSRTKSGWIIFPIVWIIRKMGVNIYKHVKNKYNMSLKSITVNDA